MFFQALQTKISYAPEQQSTPKDKTNNKVVFYIKIYVLSAHALNASVFVFTLDKMKGHSLCA